MSRHTPGSWIVVATDRTDRIGLSVWAISTSHLVIADVPSDQHDQHEANAQLIAAFPDLSVACEEIVLHWYGLDNNDEKAAQSHALRYCESLIERAITKAKGERT